MADPIAAHYGSGGVLADVIADGLQRAGKDLERLTTADLAVIDEFHIRGRKATLELAARMRLRGDLRVLDIGSGLGGPARTVAETYACHVTGIDLTPAFCDAANTLSGWVNLDDRVAFQQGDATNLPFEDDRFDAAMTIHTAMNIAAKDEMYREARRVLKAGGVFAIYDILQGEGGDVHYPVPWASEPSISHLATRDEMESLLADAGLEILEVDDSTGESQAWFEEMMAGATQDGPPPLSFQVILGSDFPRMVRNQIRNLSERRIRTMSFLCKA